METKICSCKRCGMEFEVSCVDELKKKMRSHKCKAPNKKRIRTLQLQQSEEDRFIQDVVVNRIQEENFNKLVKLGIIRAC